MRIDLGRGCFFEDGEIKSTLSKEQESEMWLTWDEGRQWVVSSLEKIADCYEQEEKQYDGKYW